MKSTVSVRSRLSVLALLGLFLLSFPLLGLPEGFWGIFPASVAYVFLVWLLLIALAALMLLRGRD